MENAYNLHAHRAVSLSGMNETSELRNVYDGRRVLVTGGTGFIGSNLVQNLVSLGSVVRVVGRKENPQNIKSVMDNVQYLRLDLRDPENCKTACENAEIVFHLASTVGGIQYSTDHHASMFAPDVTMTLNLLEACANSKATERLLIASSTCIYKHGCSIPLKEEDGFLDDPEPTALGYGWAKRTAEKAAAIFNKQYGLKSAIVRIENVYGPYDTFSKSRSHVIPALIRRSLEAERELEVWGNGDQTRSFLYVEDLVTAMLLAAEKYAVCDPINVGAGEEIKISELAKLILELLEKDHVKLSFTSDRPTGQIRKAASVEKMKEKLSFSPRFSIKDGLKHTIEWVHQNPSCLEERDI